MWIDFHDGLGSKKVQTADRHSGISRFQHLFSNRQENHGAGAGLRRDGRP
jgi:hypothetical protein